MSEKEIDILGQGNVGDGDDGDDKEKTIEELNDFSPKDEKLEIKEGASKEEVLDAILKADDESLIPWEPCVLPSRGVYYNEKNAIPNGEVQVRAWGLQTDKILSTQRLVQSGYAMDYIFKHCIKFPSPDYDPGELLAGDRIFLLYYLRGITHGNHYEFVTKCNDDACGASFTDQYDLNDLAETIKTPSVYKTEPLEIKLPFLSKKTGRDVHVGVKFLRGKDAQAALNKQKADKRSEVSSKNVKNRQARLVAIDQTVEENLNLVIVSVMDDFDPFKVKQFISKMHAADTATVRQFLVDTSPGITTRVKITCPECSNEMLTELPITESFFRPTDGGGV